LPKTQLIQHFQEERPRNRVKGLSDIQIEKNAGLFLLVQELCSMLDQHEVVQNEATFNENALVGGNQLIQIPGKFVGEDFCYQLGE